MTPSRTSDDLKLHSDTGKQLETLLGKYVSALTSNIKERLGSSLDVIEAFAIFDPLLLPNSDDDSFREYGESEVTILVNHFFPGDEDKKRKLLASGKSGKTLSNTIWNPKHHLLLVISAKEQRYFSPLHVPRDLVCG